MNRRTVLFGLGATVAATAAVGSARAVQTGLVLTDDTPFQPWTDVKRLAKGDPRSLVSAAILASNPHNTQPWKFHVSEASIEISADVNRHLGSFDPYRREMWLGLGAAVETMAVMAPGLGFSLERPRIVDLGQDGAGRIVIGFEPVSAAEDPLAPSVPERRTNRGSYSDAPLPTGLINRMRGQAEGRAQVLLFEKKSLSGRAFAEATIAATTAINADDQMGEDGHHWMRPNARAVAHYRDGVSVATSGLSPLTVFFGQMMPALDAATTGSYWEASTRRTMEASAGFGLILVEDLYDRERQIEAGRLWQRLQLMMIAEGIASQPVNQLPELVDRDRQLGKHQDWADRLSSIIDGDGKATFAFRYGWPLIEVPHSARRPVSAVLTNA